MNIANINPFIRFADLVNYRTSSGKVYVKDCRIFYISGGTADIIIENQHYKLEEGSLFYCCGGSTYEISSINGADILAINFDLTQENKDQKDSFLPIKYNDDISTNPTINITDSSFLSGHLFLEKGNVFKAQIKSIIKEFESFRLLSGEKSSSMLKTLICDLHQAAVRGNTTSFDAVNLVIDYINQNLNLQITNKELADMANYHEYHLNRLFLQTTGLSIHKYIIKQRIEEAKRLLHNTELPVLQIAEQVGFQNSAYFSNYFKNITGFTPLKYRKNMGSLI